mgnify:FL=1
MVTGYMPLVYDTAYSRVYGERSKVEISIPMDKKNNLIYSEKLTSWRTTRLFLVLALIFFALFFWREVHNGMDMPSIIFICISGFFMFYVVNYRALQIKFTSDSLQLIFGIFHWSEHFTNIEACSLDRLPMINEKGGAGIHFMMVHHRYRVSFNFLEYPRVVMALKKKRGWVQELSFSTRQPEEIIRIISENIRK